MRCIPMVLVQLFRFTGGYSPQSRDGPAHPHLYDLGLWTHRKF